MSVATRACPWGWHRSVLHFDAVHGANAVCITMVGEVSKGWV